MATQTKSGRSARTNALVGTASVLGILVLVNVLGVWAFGRVDLTENQRYTLSDVSRTAVKDLDSVDVQVFVSPDIPGTLDLGFGRERDLRGVAREFVDKLSEYQSYSSGNLRITRVTEDVEGKAEKARLELFTGKEAAIEAGRLEFRKYALGATFQYRNQMEVFPLAMEPEYFEFEITKILLRLKEKFEQSTGMKDLLDAGEAVTRASKVCDEKIASYRKKDGGAAGGLSAIVGGGNDAVANLRADAVEFKKTCDQVAAEFGRLAPLKGKNQYLDQLAATARAYVQMVDEAGRQAAGAKEEAKDLPLVLDRLVQLGDLLGRDGETLKNSPGRKAIGFLCGHREFCPFADSTPLLRPEILQMLGQNNPMIQQFAAQTKGIEDQINQVNEQIRRGLFTRKGLTVRRIDPGQDIPDDVELLVVYGPQKPLADRDMYDIDQFLLSGRSVIFFLNTWDVAVYNFKKGGGLDPSDMTVDDLHREAYPTNLGDFLANYGVQPNGDIVVEKKDFENITIVQLQKQGQYTLQSQREFPYPLLPTFTDLDRSHVLVKRLSAVTLPYASTLTVTDAARNDPARQVVELIKTSKDATATTESVELSPPYLLKQLPELAPNGPKTVAVAIKGEFSSYFSGKEIPARPDPKKDREAPQPKQSTDRPFVAKGSGRLLVVGSNLGLENLSSGKVFDGFSMAQLTSGKADFFLQLKDYVANFQNWQLRLTQITPTLQANLDFLFNALDWGVQNEALVDIRSKGYVKRPIQTVSGGGRTALTLSFIFGLPVLFALFGLFRSAARRRRT
jgi:ABC-type uncharacterized transport system involved in gliding motility auxiliary subunit